MTTTSVSTGVLLLLDAQFRLRSLVLVLTIPLLPRTMKADQEFPGVKYDGNNTTTPSMPLPSRDKENHQVTHESFVGMALNGGDTGVCPKGIHDHGLELKGIGYLSDLRAQLLPSWPEEDTFVTRTSV